MIDDNVRGGVLNDGMKGPKVSIHPVVSISLKDGNQAGWCRATRQTDLYSPARLYKVSHSLKRTPVIELGMKWRG